MKNMIRLTDFSAAEIYDIFCMTDEIRQGKYAGDLKNKSVVLFFPASSIRTRVTFEKGIYLLGGHSVLFPGETLDKKEELKDVCGYLNQWADVIVARHKDIHVLERLAEYSDVPVINGMTDMNHPCEMIADMYSLSKLRSGFVNDRFLFCGASGNIGLAWKEAAAVMGFDLSQCCEKGYEMADVKVYHNIREAVRGKDVVCTDSYSHYVPENPENFQVTKEIMSLANQGAVLNPCPPFYRGEEVSADAIDSEYFVGYAFKKHLLEVQQAIILYCLNS